MKMRIATMSCAIAGILACAKDHATTAELPPIFRDFGHGVTFSLKAKPFEANNHKLGWCDRDSAKYVCTIDGRPFFGSAGQVPVSQLESAVFQYGSHVVHLDVSSMFNPWNSNNNDRLDCRNTTDGYKVTASFSDGEGSYSAEWLVVGDASIRTVLDSSLEEQLVPEAQDR